MESTALESTILESITLESTASESTTSELTILDTPTASNRKVVIARYKERILIVVYEQEKAVSIQVYEENASLVGNIYVGKVKNILRSINAAFVEIAEGQICYYEPKNKKVLYTSQSRPGKLTVGDELTLQIGKDATKTKAPLAKADFNLSGRYLVLIYGEDGIMFSKKITDGKWKKKWEQTFQPLCPEDCGMIVRTNAYGAEDSVLLEECGRLKAHMGRIVEQAVYKKCHTRLYQAPSALTALIRDFHTVDEIVTDCADLAEMLRETFPGYQIRLYEDENLPLYKLYSMEKLARDCLSPKVWLKSGGYLVIEPTEALTVIDVNSGKFTKSSDPEGTHRKTNMEAAAEIARQIRLRNLSGMILVDFIDLKKKKDQEELLSYMDRLLRQDPVGAEALDLTRLNLMEITRRRIYKPFYEQMGEKLDWNEHSRKKVEP